MSFRSLLLPLLCVSTVVLAQGPLQPSPSFDEPIAPARIPDVDRRPIAPPTRTPTPRPNGIRLAAQTISSTPDNLQRTVANVDDTQMLGQTPAPRYKRTAAMPPRIASRAVVSGLVPRPRPLLGLLTEIQANNAAPEDVEDVDVDHLMNQLERKQQQLKQIESDVERLAAQISAAQPQQIVINIRLYKSNGNGLESIVNLLAPTNESASTGTISTQVTSVHPDAFNEMLDRLTDAKLVSNLCRPKLITLAGQTAQVEIGQSDSSFNFSVTATPADGRINLIADCTTTIDGKTRSCVINAACLTDQATAFNINSAGQTLIGVIHPQVVKRQSVSTSSKIPRTAKRLLDISAAPQQLLPIPASTIRQASKSVRAVQWLDLNLDHAPVYR